MYKFNLDQIEQVLMLKLKYNLINFFIELNWFMNNSNSCCANYCVAVPIRFNIIDK